MLLLVCVTLLSGCAPNSSLCPSPLIPPESVLQDWDNYVGEKGHFVIQYTTQQEVLEVLQNQ